MKKMLKIMMLTSLMSLNVLAVDLSFSPVYTAIDLVRSAVATPAIMGLGTTATTVDAADNTYAQAVKDDAQNYVENGVMTLKLEQTIATLKTDFADYGYADMSDEEVAAEIVANVI